MRLILTDGCGSFERLGNHRTVGEHLLQLIDVLPLTDLGESLSMDSDFYGSDLVIGFKVCMLGRAGHC